MQSIAYVPQCPITTLILYSRKILNGEGLQTRKLRKMIPVLRDLYFVQNIVIGSKIYQTQISSQKGILRYTLSALLKHSISYNIYTIQKMIRLHYIFRKLWPFFRLSAFSALFVLLFIRCILLLSEVFMSFLHGIRSRCIIELRALYQKEVVFIVTINRYHANLTATLCL